MCEIKPNKSTSPSQNLDRKSVRLVKDLLEDHQVKDSQLEEGGTLANIDGYIELLDNEDRIEAKVTVQVKHLTYSPNKTEAFYDIPQSIFGYAQRMKGELVIFIACDTDNMVFYWKHISKDFIETFLTHSGHIQKTLRYHFTNNEICDKNTVDLTLHEWRRLFKQMVNSIRDEKSCSEQFALTHRIPFMKITKGFSGIENSYIPRDEVNVVLQWINSPLNEEESNFCLISGNAGVGKTVIVRDIIDNLDKQGIKCFCIKADAIDFLSDNMTLDKFLDTIHYLKSDQGKIVVIIDQIDALSQYLTNDRNKVNLFVTLLNYLLSEKDVRIVVSCRKFDLDFDDEIKSVCKSAKVVEVGLLSDENVKSVIDAIDESIIKQTDIRTRELLRTAQFLDIFCRICKVKKERINFSNMTDLYDSYWQLLTTPIGSISSENLENLMFDLSNLMLNSETLSPHWTPTVNILHVADCLASRGAITYDNHRIAFIHQSFYDYVLARNCVSKNINYVESVENQFQGFEIRSTIKAVLVYERDHGTEEYLKSLRKFLSSSKIRDHIKFLILSLVAFSTEPQRNERAIIKQLCTTEKKYFTYFLKCITNDSWFITLRSVVASFMEQLTKNDEICYPIANFLSKSSFRYAKEVFNLIDGINDQETKDFLMSIILRGHNDYSEECVMEAFSSYYKEVNSNLLFVVPSLKDAISTNKTFALQKTRALLTIYLSNTKEFDNRHDSYELVEVLCKGLAKNYSEDFLDIMHSVFVDIIDKFSYNSYYKGLSANTIFGWHMDQYVEELYQMYKQALIVSFNGKNKRKKVLELLETKDICASCLALEIISLTPILYSDIIRKWLSTPKIIDIYLSADTEYYILQVLHNWYMCLSAPEKVQYEAFVLNYVSESDSLADKDRHDGLLFPFLWRNKWKLICSTIPVDSYSLKIARCRQELVRRFEHYFILKKPDHRYSMAQVCTGVTSKENYLRFDKKQWSHSFQHLTDEWKYPRKPIDLRIHASMFEESVASRPAYFKKFVFEIFENKKIDNMYKIAGLKGLLKATTDLEQIWPLAKQFLTIDFAQNNCIDFSTIWGHYIVNNNPHFAEIFEVLIEIVKLPSNNNRVPVANIGRNELEKKVNNLITQALNSPQGKAIELMLKACKWPERRLFVYGLLDDLHAILGDDIKVLVLYYIFTKDCYDEQLSRKIFVKYIHDVGSIAIYLNTQTIQYYLYHQLDVVREYLEIIEQDPFTNIILCQLYYYGLVVPSIHLECQNKLERILNNDDEHVIAEIVKVALSTYHDSEFHDYAKVYLKKYATDGRDAVVYSYCVHCDSLTVNDFDFFVSIYVTIKTNKYVELSDLLKYLKKCANRYPVECYKFIRDNTSVLKV